MRHADVVASKQLKGSKNLPLRLTLSRNGVEARAIFRTVDKKKASARVGDVMIRDFQDSYRFECAAYELSRLLAIPNVPPCVFRTIDGQRGSLQLWVEDAVTEYQYRTSQDGPSATDRWPTVFERLKFFDALIHNFDRHAGNILVDASDRVWFIDHTRSFRLYTNAPVENVPTCDNVLVERLEQLSKDDLQVLKQYISPRHVDALWRRKGQLIKHCRGVSGTSVTM